MEHGRRDSTHKEIREELRNLGASVADTADLGHSFPDLVVGLAGATFLVEAKAAKGKLSDGQSEFARTWRGAPVVVLRSRIEAREWLIRTRHELAGRTATKQLAPPESEKKRILDETLDCIAISGMHPLGEDAL